MHANQKMYLPSQRFRQSHLGLYFLILGQSFLPQIDRNNNKSKCVAYRWRSVHVYSTKTGQRALFIPCCLTANHQHKIREGGTPVSCTAAHVKGVYSYTTEVLLEKREKKLSLCLECSRRFLSSSAIFLRHHTPFVT